jgi:putative DNA primase/helicase
MNAHASPDMNPDVKAMLAHLEFLAAPARERFRDALIEIAWDAGATNEKNAITRAKLFGLNELDAAAAHAAERNAHQYNVYVGAFLKKPNSTRGKRTKADDFYVATAIPIDFDEDADGVFARLAELGVRAGAIVTTGRTPSLRQQRWHWLTEPCDHAGKCTRAFENAVGNAGADTSATGLNRLMRLAGSVSYPPGKKRAKGYVVEQTGLEIDDAAEAVTIGTFLDLAPAPENAETKHGGAGSGNEFQPTGTFFRDVGTLALTKLDAWVPALFGQDAQSRPRGEGYRVSSEALGRDLEEDLSLHPSGIKDFGVHDGERDPLKRQGKRTPIDIVLEWGEQYGATLDNGATPTTRMQAAHWLCEQLGIDPQALKIGGRPQSFEDIDGGEAGETPDGAPDNGPDTGPGKGDGVASKPRNESNSDLGNARRLVRRHGSDMRYMHARRKWAVWDSERWRIDENGAVIRLAKQTIEAMHDDAKTLTNDTARADLRKHALYCQSAARIEAMVRLAESEAEVVADSRLFDANPWLLGVRNGVLDLKTGGFREARRGDFITKSANVDFDRDAVCPNWLEFLDTVTDCDRELIGYLQRLVGYVLTGTAHEEVMTVLWGTGRNGKSTFRETVHDMMGDYAISADAGLLVTRQTPGGATPDVARLQGRRLVSINETAQNDQLNEARVKFITSNDRIAARNLYSEPFDFLPTHKTFLTTNHKPVIRGADEGIWRRVHLTPFTIQIPVEKIERDFRTRRLLPEMSGILNWALVGLADYQRVGLNPPECVRGATKSYREEMDFLRQWIEERCERDPAAIVPTSVLHSNYVQWSSENHGYTMRAARFGRELSDRGFEGRKQGRVGVRCIVGLKLASGCQTEASRSAAE